MIATFGHRCRPRALACAAAALWAPMVAWGQGVPDAGRVLQQPPAAVQPLVPSAPFVIQAPHSATVAAGGLSVELRGVRIQGVTRYDSAALQALLADSIGARLDLAGLRGLAERLTQRYRADGFPYARAFLPPQDMADGLLRIEIIEGRYGAVRARAGEPVDAAMAPPAQRFLEPLRSGEVIESGPLERAVLLLGDLPGVVIEATLSPGSEVGSGDLTIDVRGGPRVMGELGVDNHGNRFTGVARVRGQIAANRVLVLGDELRLNLMTSDEGLRHAQVGYAWPLDARGRRAEVHAVNTDYRLGGDFEALDARGRSQALGLSLQWPLLRSVRANVLLSGGLNRRKLRDGSSTPATDQRKSLTVVPLSLQFDRRDMALGGGVSYGLVSWHQGRLTLDDGRRAADAAGAGTEGRYGKLGLDLNRLQSLGGGRQLAARLAAQWVGQNLDSSEAWVLGGFHGVRAYPQGEAAGDQGWLLKLDLRQRVVVGAQSALVPYAFYDTGSVRIDAEPYQPGPNRRSVSGVGAGVAVEAYRVRADLAVAWRLHGGEPQSDSRKSSPRLLLSLNASL